MKNIRSFTKFNEGRNPQYDITGSSWNDSLYDKKYKEYLPKGFKDELTRPLKDIISSIKPSSNDIYQLMEFTEKMDKIAGKDDWKEIMKKSSKIKDVESLITYLKDHYIKLLEKKIK